MTPKALLKQIDEALIARAKERRAMDENSRRAARDAIAFWKKVIEKPSLEAWLTAGVAYAATAKSVAEMGTAYAAHDLAVAELKQRRALAKALDGSLDA